MEGSSWTRGKRTLVVCKGLMALFLPKGEGDENNHFMGDGKMNVHSDKQANDAEKTFVEMLKSGECATNDIDTYIGKWHNEYNGKKKLYEYLGMTKQQYDRWMVEPGALESMF